ncbi:MAG: T9SS type A sorting domain-containing protein, partial [Chitinophagales bacterium]|nr:T9SS type A sorting domain-containing protein [Chitinophagales bacterium]
RVFPNPATEWVAIEVEHNRHFAGTLTVRNALGQTVYENQRYDGAAIIHTSALPSGMYVYYIQSKNNTWSGTFAVRR